VSSPSPAIDASVLAARLIDRGFVHLRETHNRREVAWRTAHAVFATAALYDAIGSDMPGLEVVGEFTLPPPGVPHRAFQALHIDFGLPIESEAADVARFTALYIDLDHPPTSARTRLVLLRRLLSQRSWADPSTLQTRLRDYGRLQRGDNDYIEGILARLIEAADESPSLPSPGSDGFLCGMEFSSRADERAHLFVRGLELDGVEEQVLLAPGGLLLFDNLATAHGRLGLRDPLELHQLCVGYARLDARAQRVLLGRVLDAFSASNSPARANT
jgi:hypothetical protein